MKVPKFQKIWFPCHVLTNCVSWAIRLFSLRKNRSEDKYERERRYKGVWLLAFLLAG